MWLVVLLFEFRRVIPEVRRIGNALLKICA